MWILVLAAGFPATCQTSGVEASSKPNQIVSQEVVISGTTTLDTTELNEVAIDLTSRRIGEDDQEIRARIRDAFQRRGYFDAGVTSLKVRPLDALARPKPVRIEAEVAEGVRFKFAGFNFTGNHALSAEQLRKLLPLQAGEFFSTEKVRSGLASIRKEYTAKGYLDFTLVPKTDKVADGQLTLTFDITEGPQYRMGALEIEGKPEQAEQLQPQWKLKSGEPFDAGYLDQFLDENRASLPSDFGPSRDLYMVRDCRDMSVTIHIELDPKRAWQKRPEEVQCDKAKDSAKQPGH
jgi:outer membrane translocation and assembly module TamA